MADIGDMLEAYLQGLIRFFLVFGFIAGFGFFVLMKNTMHDTKTMQHTTSYEMVKENHQVFEQEVNEVKYEGHLEEQSDAWKTWVAFRMKLIREEVDELEKALLTEEPANALKEGCDVQYVLDGTFVSLKDFPDLMKGPFQEVHSSNMSKLGEDGKPIKREDGKYLKGPNFRRAEMNRFFQDYEF